MNTCVCEGDTLLARACSALTRIGLAVLLLAACSEQAATVAPVDITRDTTCALDGMVLADYPGPKGQIHYDRGSPDFFCDTMELISIHLRPEQQKRVVALFVQDMGQADWNEPRGHWIDARGAFYVRGSGRHGSMGPTLASFAREDDAQAFAKRHGGKVLRFNEITIDMVALDGGVIRDERM
ncbi:MAG: nitrous oxide reductase accessory protein NosL [Betaproteobacteria bacterium]|nr:nitrous oxide reductase accessory protein NosL [Betaproteobacteria bacterium]